MRGSSSSLTATLVAAMRALYTAMPEPYQLTKDPLAAALIPAPFTLPARLVAHAPWAAAAIHDGLGALTLGTNYHVPLRTRAIDDALREALHAGVEQVVVLGAGLDSRAMRLDELAPARVFEVDHPSTQRYKMDRLASHAGTAELKARELVRVAVDFENDRLDRALPMAGFDPAARSFWIWEGVTVYLTPQAIDATLDAVQALSAQRSRIALTYSPVDATALPRWATPFATQALALIGEPLRTPLTRKQVEGRLARTGFAVVSDESTADWAARYWPWQKNVRSIERLAIAERT